MSIAAVQARISEIHAMFGAPASISSSASAAAAASAAITSASAASTAAAPAGATGAGDPFAAALTQAQSLTGAAPNTVPGAIPGAVPGVAATDPTASLGTVGTASEQQAVSAARKYLGIPYLWGGTDPAKGMDCSGLTQRVFKDMGIDIPRVSADQARGGRQVASLEQARPGDLVFYDYSSRPGIDHVAMYIGNGKIIEAERTGTNIKVDDVGSPIAIRRYLPETTTVTAGTTAASSVPTLTPALSPATVTGAVTGAAGLSGVPYANLFTEAGAKHGVPAALLAAVAKTESAFNPAAVSPAGAQGLMQFMPATAQGMGVNPLNPASAIDGAARYLSAHLREFGSVDLALAAYNAGPGNVRKYGGIPPFTETQNYVARVKTAWEDYR